MINIDEPMLCKLGSSATRYCEWVKKQPSCHGSKQAPYHAHVGYLVPCAPEALLVVLVELQEVHVVVPVENTAGDA